MRLMLIFNQGLAIWSSLIEELANLGHELILVIPQDAKISSQILAQISASKTKNFAPIQVKSYYFDRRGLNPFKELRTCLAIYQILRQNPVDLIFTASIKLTLYTGLSYNLINFSRQKLKNSQPCQKTKFTTAITGHGLSFEADNLAKSLLKFFICQGLRFALKNSQQIFFQNSDDLKIFQEHNLIANNTKITQLVLCGVNLDHFQAKALPKINLQVEISQRQINFLLIARLLFAKGLLEYYQAASILKKIYPKCNFWLLGAKEKGLGAIRDKDLQAWQASGTIKYLGLASDVRSHLAKAHVVVLPSYHEGLPLAILEALATARPVIASNSSGCRELITNDLNGYLCQIKNATNLAKTMEIFIKNPQKIVELAKNCRQTVKKYEQNEATRQLIHYLLS